VDYVHTGTVQLQFKRADPPRLIRVLMMEITNRYRQKWIIGKTGLTNWIYRGNWVYKLLLKIKTILREALIIIIPKSFLVENLLVQDSTCLNLFPDNR